MLALSAFFRVPINGVTLLLLILVGIAHLGIISRISALAAALASCLDVGKTSTH